MNSRRSFVNDDGFLSFELLLSLSLSLLLMMICLSYTSRNDLLLLQMDSRAVQGFIQQARARAIGLGEDVLLSLQGQCFQEEIQGVNQGALCLDEAVLISFPSRGLGFTSTGRAKYSGSIRLSRDGRQSRISLSPGFGRISVY